MVQMLEFSPMFENDRVRVFDVNVRRGDKWAMHSHPDFLFYGMSDGTYRLTMPDGTTQDVHMRPGMVSWQKATTHEVENIGQTDLHALLVEFK